MRWLGLKILMLPFENCELPCPSGWDALLTAQYGDWRIPVMGGSLHEGVEIDLDCPYMENIKKKLSKMPFWKRYLYKH
jgi:lipopolysaccharide cholinephosphotransferase